EFDTLLAQPCNGVAQGSLGLLRCDGPTGGLEENEPFWRLRRGNMQGPVERQAARIAANARGDFDGDLPGVFQRRGKHAGATLAQVIMASAPVERAYTRLKTDAAAIAGRTNDRANHLRTEAGAENAGADRGRGAAAGTAGRACQIVRIACAARMG